jgi:hypothetical protein
MGNVGTSREILWDTYIYILYICIGKHRETLGYIRITKTTYWEIMTNIANNPDIDGTKVNGLSNQQKWYTPVNGL